MQIVILAGGLGTRMAHLSADKPKALIEVHGQPFLQYQIDWLKRTGATRLTFSIGYRAEQIRDYLQTAPNPGVNIDWVQESQPLGTAGALRWALDQGRLDEKFLLLYGDSYLPLDVSQVWEKFHSSGLPALMTVFKNNGQFDRSNAHYADGLVPFYSKVNPCPGGPLKYIDYGLSGLSRGLISEQVPAGQKCDLATVFENLSLKKQLAGLEVLERFYEVGSPQGLKEFADYVDRHLHR